MVAGRHSREWEGGNSGQVKVETGEDQVQEGAGLVVAVYLDSNPHSWCGQPYTGLLRFATAKYLAWILLAP